MATNYFENITVNVAAFPVTPQADLGFISQGISMLNLDSTDTIEYSFDGTNLHGDLVPGTGSTGVVFDDRYESKIWFRTSGVTADVRVEAWTNYGKIRA